MMKPLRTAPRKAAFLIKRNLSKITLSQKTSFEIKLLILKPQEGFVYDCNIKIKINKKMKLDIYCATREHFPGNPV